MANVCAVEPQANFANNLKSYYKKIFPCELFCQWLTYGSDCTNELARREFSFTLKDDIYIRYQSFMNSAELRRELVRLCPYKIDIGAVYSAPPKLHRSIMSSSLKPEWKELVFDVDLTDFDEVRYCCGSQSATSDSVMCPRCWQLARSTVLCIDRALREDFGYEHLLWVYSGRRGVHCWVCDPSARRLDSSARSAVVDYLTLVRGGSGTKPNLGGHSSSHSTGFRMSHALHPSVEAACDILLPRFSSYCSTLQGQDLFGRKDRLQSILSYLPPDAESERVRFWDRWSNEESDPNTPSKEVSIRRWNTLQKHLTDSGRSTTLKEIILRYTYPRLDANVSTGVNHLLKSPFCAHPKTGQICVPFDPREVDKLDPSTCPTIDQIIAEMYHNTSIDDNATISHVLPYKKTSLKNSIEFFEAFVQQVCPSSPDADQALSRCGEVNTSSLLPPPSSLTF